MPPKRPTDAAPTGAQLKRQRMRDQRNISVQAHEGKKGGSAGSGASASWLTAFTEC